MVLTLALGPASQEGLGFGVGIGLWSRSRGWLAFLRSQALDFRTLDTPCGFSVNEGFGLSVLV